MSSHDTAGTQRRPIQIFSEETNHGNKGDCSEAAAGARLHQGEANGGAARNESEAAQTSRRKASRQARSDGQGVDITACRRLPEKSPQFTRRSHLSLLEDGNFSFLTRLNEAGPGDVSL